MAAACLALGIVLGYLVRGSGNRESAGGAIPTKQDLTDARLASNSTPTSDQMMRMAEKAAEPARAELQKDPNNQAALAKLGSVYFRTQQFSLSVEYYERAVKAKPSAEGYVSLSNAYHYAGADDRAIDALNRALQLDPKSANALFNLGLLDWQAKNDPEAAIKMWELLLKTHPDHPRRATVEGMIVKAKKHLNMPAGTTTAN